MLVDLADDAGVRQELPMIAAEVRRLRAAFGSTNTGFDAGAGAFLEVLDLLTAPVTAPGTAECPPPPRSVRWPVPIALRLGAGAPAPSHAAVSPQQLNAPSNDARAPLVNVNTAPAGIPSCA